MNQSSSRLRISSLKPGERPTQWVMIFRFFGHLQAIGQADEVLQGAGEVQVSLA